MGYSRAGNRRVMKVLTRAAYTNFGDPNRDYSFLNNGGAGSLSVQLKTFAGNFVRGDIIRIRNYLGGANTFNVTTQGSDTIKIGLSANSAMVSATSVTVTKEAPLEITWLSDNFDNLHALTTSST